MRLAVFSFLLILLFLTAPIKTSAYEDLKVKINGGETFPADYKADFYIVTTYENQGRVDATIVSLKIYYGGKLVKDLTKSVKRIDVGFYWVQYPIPKNAREGVYNIIAEAKYGSANASAIKAFTVSNSLLNLAVQVSEVKKKIEALKMDLVLSIGGITETLTTIEDRIGYIEEEIDRIDDVLKSVNGSIEDVASYLAELNETSGNLQINLNGLMSDLQDLKSKINSINTQVSNIKVDTSTIEASIGEYTASAQQTTTKIATKLWIILIVSIVSVVGSILGFLAIIELGRLLNEKFRLTE